jgi:hypothetical protein
MTLPCTAQCNIEISQGGIASAPTSQRAFAFAALTANIPAAGGGFSQSFPTLPSPPLRLSCAFQQACVAMTAAHLCPQDFQGKTRTYSPLLQEALRARFTPVCEIEHRDQGSQFRRIGDMQFSCPEPKSANTGRHAGRSQAMGGGRAGLRLESFVKPHVDHTHRAWEL